MKVYLDDERPLPRGWVGVNTANDAIELLQLGIVTHLDLDHDLGCDKTYGTGYDVICWIEIASLDASFKFPVVTIHTDNPVGRRNIERVLEAIDRRHSAY